MLSTSSTNNTEQTNFINVETEPFTNPLRLESSEKENSVHNSNNDDLASQMEKLEVSRVSVDLFSQLSSSSKFSLPPNRVLSNQENIDNISQRISNICMSGYVDLADTQPNTLSQRVIGSPKPHLLADTQPNSSPIVLSSDGEDDNDADNDAGDNEMTESLLTEESDEDDSVIEILSSDNSFESAHDHIPQNISSINTDAEEITESVAQKENRIPQNILEINTDAEKITDSDAQKLDHFFDNVPNLNVSHDNYNRKADLDNTVRSEINVSETEGSEKENSDENNILQLQASQLDENIGNTSSGNISSSVRNSDNEPDNQSILNESDNMGSESLHLNQSSDEKQVSVHEARKKIEFEKIKTSSKSLISLNSPIINISAKVSINIQLSGFCSSTTSSDTDETSENADAASEESSKNNDSVLPETGVDTSREFVAHCNKRDIHTSGSNSKEVYIDSPNHKSDDNDDSHTISNEISPNSSVIESSRDDIQEIQNMEDNNSSICDSLTSLVDLTKELIVADTSTSKQDENNVSVSPIDTSVEIDEVGEQILTDIYGDAWRTPQLIKKCLSTRKKCLTDIPKRDASRGFSLCEYPSIHFYFFLSFGQMLNQTFNS